MKNHFYISYVGNKREEVKEIYKSINFSKTKIIIEPFCGSCAMSFYISTIHKNLTYVLNDNNKFLLEMFEIIKSNEKTEDFDKKITELFVYINKTKEKYIEIIKQDNVYGWFIKNRAYNIRIGLFPTNNKWIHKSLKEYPIYNFFLNEKIIFTCDDAIKCYETYKDNPNALILLDPPYLMSDNNFYLNSSVNIYEYLLNNSISKEKAQILIILEKNWIIDFLFKKEKCIEYDKSYQLSKKKTTHKIITNQI